MVYHHSDNRRIPIPAYRDAADLLCVPEAEPLQVLLGTVACHAHCVCYCFYVSHHHYHHHLFLKMLTFGLLCFRFISTHVST